MKRGFTLLELMVGSTLFLLLTGLIITTLVYAFQRGAYFDAKQETLQEFAIFRERLQQSLRDARIQLSGSSPSLVQFVLPVRVPTAQGNLNLISYAEQVQWDEANVFEITLVNSGNSLIQRRLVGDPDQTQILWNLGTQPSFLEFDFSNMPVLKVTVQSRDSDTSPPWSRTLLLVVENFI